MAITLFDLAGADPDLRFSPYCWRTRLALAHKELPAETVPWRFTEKARLAFSGGEKVPVIVDGGRAVADSWAIAEYLEDTYCDRPSLFGGVAGRAHAKFINAWADRVMNPAMARLLVLGGQPWLGGGGPSYADYIVFGSLQWARCISRFELLAADDPLSEWRGRMLALFGGLSVTA